jgi:hypothetical protein
MSAFDDIKLGWRGETHVIPARMSLEAIARIEEIITLEELANAAARGAKPSLRLSRAFASVLRFAGAHVTDEEVYTDLFGSGMEILLRTQNLATTLQVIMVPPQIRKRLEEQVERAHEVRAVGQAQPSGNREAASGKASSKPHSKCWSEPAGSHPKRSGPGRRWKSFGSSKRRRRSR